MDLRQHVAPALLAGGDGDLPPVFEALGAFGDSLATLRSVSSGWIPAAPSSVAFCITQSIFSLLVMACASTTCNGDSRLVLTAVISPTTTRLPPSSAMTPWHSLPAHRRLTRFPSRKRNTRAA
jgi:hypothetical protein